MVLPLKTLVTLLVGAALGAIAPAVASETAEQWQQLDTKGWIFLDEQDPGLGTVTPLKGRDRLVIIPKREEKMFGVTMENGATCTVTVADGLGFTLLTMSRTGEAYGLTVGTGDGRLTAAWQGPDLYPVHPGR
jgi:hypothetical protein